MRDERADELVREPGKDWAVRGVDTATVVDIAVNVARVVYVSTACVADRHGECRIVDKFRGMPCMCPTCGHVSVPDFPAEECRPLLHYAEEYQELGYRYQGLTGLGVRGDLYRAARQALVALEGPLSRVMQPEEYKVLLEKLALDQAVGMAVALAPRML